MAEPMDMRKYVVPEFVYGMGTVRLAGQYAASFGAKKALIVTDAGIIAVGLADRVRQALTEAGVDSVIFADVTSNPKDAEVMAGAALYLRDGCDVIVAVGGGSPMDCAKGIGVVSTNSRHILEFEGVDEVPVPGPPLICIPTTAGTAADISQFAIINDTKRRVKIAIISKTVVPDLALIDPAVTFSMPPELTAATGLDALVHAFEAFVSNASSPVTDLTALEAIRLVGRHLIGAIAEPENRTHRDNMMMASLMAGMAFSNASLGLVHGMAHSLGGAFDLPHGMCNAILLEHVVAFNFPAAPERYARIAEALSLPVAGMDAQDVAPVLLEGIRRLRHAAGISSTLGKLGVPSSALESLARNAFQDPCLATNPREASREEIRYVYEQAL